jgi:hypothetical protein
VKSIGPLKSIGDLAEEELKRARHRKFHWCRLRNDFVDMALWRVVAQALGLPLTQVQAFVTRLDILANRSLPRGYVGDFDAHEFGAAHDMPAADCARLFAALEERGWIEQERLTTFWERNPDKDDATASERKERERAFKGALRELARQAHEGIIGAPERTRREIAIFALRDQGRHGLLTWAQQRPKLDVLMHFSTGHASHSVTDRDIVTVTPRADQKSLERPVDNSGDSARGEKAAAGDGASGTPGDPQAAAQMWLDGDGLRIVIERMEEVATKSMQRIARWRDQELDGDGAALAEIIRGADATDYMGARFHNLVTDGIRRRRQQVKRPQLPLGLPRPKGRAHG